MDQFHRRKHEISFALTGKTHRWRGMAQFTLPQLL